jgi:methionyl-tRNA formyltransferase
MTRLRLAFMGTPDFSVPTLAALIAAGHEIAAVYCQPPRPAGRGMAARPSPVQAFAEARGLAVRHPVTLKTPDAQADFAALGLDAAVVVAYGLILPRPVLDAPRLGCFNVHASLLPRWRGAAPIQRAILAGDAETGVTIMRMEAGLDTGPMLKVGRVAIGPTTTASDLHDALAELGAGLMVEVLQGVAAGTLPEMPQPDEGVTYAAKIAKDEGRIDWARPAPEIDRLVRALGASPGTWTEIGGERLKVLGVETATGSGAPGEVLDDRLAVACGAGALRIMRAQRPGKAPQDAETLLRGWRVAPGTRLG